MPWFTQRANSLLPTLLKKPDVGLEFGSGRSTFWFARRVAALTSVEHNAFWHKKVSKTLKEQGLSNVQYLLIPTGLMLTVPTENGIAST